MTAASDYREMLTEELAAVRRVSPRSIESILEESWSDGHANPRGWSPPECHAAIVWAGLGMLAFGRLDYLEETLALLRDHPGVVFTQRGLQSYVAALSRLVPLPDPDPPRALAWLHRHRDQLVWNEKRGRFVEVTP